MNRDNTLVDRWEFWAALPLLAVISVGCGAVRNPALERARDAYQRAEAEHLAYIAEKRVEIARATARRRLAADEIQQLKSKRE